METEAKTDTTYGAAKSTGRGYGKQQSLLSAPPSSNKIKAPKVVEYSSVSSNAIHKFSKIVIWLFVAFGFISLILIILWVASDFNGALLMAAMLAVTIVLSLFGAWGYGI